MFKNLFTALVRTHLEYANKVWRRYYKSKGHQNYSKCTEASHKINPHTKNIDMKKD